MFWCIYIGLILFVSLLGRLHSAQAWAPTEKTPVLQKINEAVEPERVPPYSNKDCQNHITFITMPARLLSNQSEQSTQTCAVATAYGLQSATDTTVSLTGSRLAGPVVAQSGGRLIGQAVPSSKHFLFQGSGTYGSKQYLVKNFADNSRPIIEPTGTIRHQLSASASIVPIADSNHTALEFADIRSASNGQWLVGDVPFQGLTRVNTETGQTLTFGDAYNYAIGIRPHYVLSISGDGRYVFAAAAGYDLLKVYDLANCSPVNQVRFSCSSRDLFSFMKASLPNFQSVHHAQFSTSKTIRLYLNYSGKTGYFLLKADDAEESQLDYLALGDSFTSGEGTFDYKKGTDTEFPFNKCHLSDFSYPFLLQQSQAFNRVESVACSGAKIKDIRFDDPTKNYRSDARQSRGKEHHLNDSEVYADFLVGYRPQIDFVEQYKPRTVTVSIGGNDIGFGQIIASCLAPGTCYDDPAQKADLLSTIASKKDQFIMLFQHLKQAAATDASVYVIGYPALADPNGTCGLNVQLNKNELEFGNEIVAHLNETVRQAAEITHVTYIDIMQVLQGHRLCENTGDQLAVNGLTAGNDKTFTLALDDLAWSIDFYLTGRESYHPTKLGHQLYAKKINEVFTHLNLSTPEATYRLTASPSVNSRRVIFDNSLTPSMALRGNNIAIYASDILPNADKSLYLNSIPLTFAQQSTSSHSMSATAQLPNTLAPGIYGLRLHTKNIVGELVEFQKVIYVANSIEDIDGDTIPNNMELCLLVEPALVDADNDNLDDNCDGQITSRSKRFDEPALASGLKIGPAAFGFNPNHHQPTSDPQSSVLGTTAAMSNPLQRRDHKGTSEKDVGHSHKVFIVTAIVLMLSGGLLYLWGRGGIDWRKHLQ